MNLRLRLTALAVRTNWPRPRPLTPLQEAATEATRQLVLSRVAAKLARTNAGTP